MKFTAPRRLHWLLILSAVIIFVDRLTKTWVALRIPYGGAIPVIPHVLRITHWTNDGAAFSLFANTASPHSSPLGFDLLLVAGGADHSVSSGPPRQQFHAHHCRPGADLCRRAGQRSRPHRLRLGGGLHRGPHLQLPLAGLQHRRLVRRHRRLPAAARRAVAEKTRSAITA
jgi:hypothetical protein